MNQNTIGTGGSGRPSTSRILPAIDAGGDPQPHVLPSTEALTAPVHSPIRSRHGDLVSGRRARRIEARVTREKGRMR
jgi:hypothetical protein